MMDDEKSMIDGNTVFASSETEQPVAAQAAARETVRLVTEQGLTLTEVRYPALAFTDPDAVRWHSDTRAEEDE